MEASISSNRAEHQPSLPEARERPGCAPHSLGSLIRAQLNALIAYKRFPTPVEDKLLQLFELFTRESLVQPAAPPFSGLSHINADGLPFQWVFRCGPGEDGFGFLCEAGIPGKSPGERCKLTLSRVLEACDVLGHYPFWFDELSRTVLPESDKSWPSHWRSAMWVGVSASQKGILLKPYFNLNRGSPRERWLLAGRLLKQFNRTHGLETLCALSSVVSSGCLPAGLAVDIVSGEGPGRIKIYFRSHEVSPEWVNGWYAFEGWDRHRTSLQRGFEHFKRFGSTTFPAGAFTVSLESHLNNAVSLKCDFAVTKWMASDREIFTGVRAFADDLGFDANGLQQAFSVIGAWPLDVSSCSVLRFVGLGYEPDGSTHINLYVAPPLISPKPARPKTSHTVEATIAAGCEFLAQAQTDGHWTDFDLPVGPSDAWVTAYVLAQLAKVDSRFWNTELRGGIESALTWLASKQRTCGAWGYNDNVLPDADSTAWAVLALKRHGRIGNLDLPKVFERWRGPAGGFATYTAADSPGPGWAVATPDVTAAVLNASSANWDDESEKLFSTWLQPGGTLPAYWWTSQFYTASLLLEWQPKLAEYSFLSQAANHFERTTASFAFDLALQLHCLNRFRSKRATETARLLYDSQATDGSWPASAHLRLTDDAVTTPWEYLCAGPLYRDIRSIFTTATAVSSLSHLTH